MIDREKVIKAVECRKNVHKRCGNPCERVGDCEYAIWARDSDSEPYYPCCCDIERLCDDILLLLKEQEALPIVYETNNYTGLPIAHCPSCGEYLEQFHSGVYGKETKFCYYCGQAVKWNDD